MFCMLVIAGILASVLVALAPPVTFMDMPYLPFALLFCSPSAVIRGIAGQQVPSDGDCAPALLLHCALQPVPRH